MSEMTSTITTMQEAFLYTGQERAAIPDGVTRVRVAPSVTRIPPGLLSSRKKLEEVELCEGLEEIGEYAFSGCLALKRIRIPSTVTRILDYAFSDCRKLEEVELSEGLLEIGANAFILCASLRHIVIPKTVRVIGKSAFCCAALSSIDLPDGLEHIGNGAFHITRLQNIRIPPLVTEIARQLFVSSGCYHHFLSVELPEGLNQINWHAFHNCHSLRNIAIPSNSVIADGAFYGVSDLEKLFVTESRIKIELKHRFDGLPIHRMMYYQSYHTAETALENLNAAIDPRAGLSRKLRSRLNPTGKQQDCLGMTPLHILACSAKQNLAFYQVIVEKYPENLITADKWGALPILYALWVNAPSEIVQFLIESYKTQYPALDLSWTKMVETLGRAAVPSDILEYVRVVQYESFPEQEIDWDDVLEKLVEEERFSFTAASQESFKCLIRCSIAKRLNAIGIKLWREDIMFMTTALEPSDAFDRRGCLDDIRAKLADYEVGYHGLKEATTMLELALWKKEINELNKEKMRQNKKIKLDEAGLRQQCRISCGSDVIIERVLPYLLPSQNMFVFDVDSDDESSSEDEFSSEDEPSSEDES